MDEYERNLVLRIAKGEVSEDELDEPLTEEQKEDLEFERKLMALHEANGMGELNDAMCIDNE